MFLTTAIVLYNNFKLCDKWRQQMYNREVDERTAVARLGNIRPAVSILVGIRVYFNNTNYPPVDYWIEIVKVSDFEKRVYYL